MNTDTHTPVRLPHGIPKQEALTLKSRARVRAPQIKPPGTVPPGVECECALWEDVGRLTYPDDSPTRSGPGSISNSSAAVFELETVSTLTEIITHFISLPSALKCETAGIAWLRH